MKHHDGLRWFPRWRDALSRSLTVGACAAIASLGLPAAASAGSITDLGEGFPVSMNTSDHILVANLGYEEAEGGQKETFKAPWSIWSGGKSTHLEPLNGEPNGEPESINHEHKLELYNINEAGYVGGSSSVINQEGSETKSLQRAISITPTGEIHEVPLLEEEIEKENSKEELESRHVGSLGTGIDNAGDVVGVGAEEVKVEGKPRAAARGFIDRGGTSSPPEVVGEADKPAEGEWASEVFEVNGSGTMFGDIIDVNEKGEDEKPIYYLWKSPSEAGTRLNFDTPVRGLASDGSVLGERAGTVYLREPGGQETAISNLERPDAVNASHQVVGSETVGGAEHAAVWQQGKITDLNTLLPAKSGWVLQRATAINDNGDIAGIGAHEGLAQAFLLRSGCGPLKLTSAVPARPGPFGAHPDTDVTLTGTGLCAGMVVTFGNKKATVTAEAADVSADGTSATVEIPRLATTGTLSVELKGATAELPDSFPIDSFRNTEGFQFANLSHVGNYSEMASVFGSAAVYEKDTVNTCAPASCPTPQLVPNQMLLKAFENIYRPAEERGLCYGFALAGLQFATGAASLADFSTTAQNAFGLGTTGSPGPTLEAFLATRFLMQFSDQARANVEAQRTDPGRTPDDLRAEIEDYTDSGSGLLVSLEGTVTAAIGGTPGATYKNHTMIATGVEDDEDETGGYLINVVDSNIPYTPGPYSEEELNGIVHAARATQIHVPPTGRWSYENSSGALDEIFVTPLSVFKAPLTIGGKGSNPSLIGAYAAAGVDLGDLENGAGETLTVDGPTGGVVADPPATSTAGSAPSAAFIAPFGAYTNKLVSSGAPVGETWTSPELLASAKTAALEADVSFDPKSSKIGYSPLGHPKRGPTELTLISDPARGTARTATIDSSASTAGVTAALSSARDQLEVSAGATTKVTITLSQTGGPDALTAQHVPAFTLRAGESASVAPATWRGRSSTAIAITLKPKRGRAHTLHLRAHTHIPLSAARIAHVIQRRAHGRVKIAMQLRTPSLPAGSSEAVTALLIRHGARARSYRLLPTRLTSTGDRALQLTIDPGDRPATVRIVIDTILSTTGQLATRTVKLRIRG